MVKVTQIERNGLFELTEEARSELVSSPYLPIGKEERLASVEEALKS